MTDRYDSRTSTDGTADFDEQTEFKYTPYTNFETNIAAAFGAESEFGQSLGVVFEDITLKDGALFLSDSGKFKLFSLGKAGAIDPEKALERDMDVSVDDVDEFMSKDYNVAQVDYDLVAARVPTITDGDGSVLIESSSKKRRIEADKNGEIEFGEWEDLDGDTVDVEEDLITYFGADDNTGASIESQRMAEVLTKFGSNAVEDPDDAFGWLADSSGKDVLRSDLEDRRVEIIKTIKTGDDSGYDYHFPMVIDTKTDTEIAPMNRGDSEGGGGAEAGSDEPAQTFPDPVANFIGSASALDLSDQRASELLDDMITDAENPLDEGTVDEVGREEIIAQVT